jgi:hypothetical protein
VASITLPRSPASLSSGDEVPRIFTRKSRVQPKEILIASEKRLLQQNLPAADVSRCSNVPGQNYATRSPRRRCEPCEGIAERDVMETSAVTGLSVRLDAGELHHFASLLSFVGVNLPKSVGDLGRMTPQSFGIRPTSRSPWRVQNRKRRAGTCRPV